MFDNAAGPGSYYRTRPFFDSRIANPASRIAYVHLGTSP